MLVLQRMNNLSDERLEYQVGDRLSFMRFMGLCLAGVVPDVKTMWVFREELKEKHLIERLFARFDECLRELDVELRSGQIIDATFVTVPRQRNTREENKLIKAGAVTIEWSQRSHKLAQKDIDARWTKKNTERFYGYKNRANVDRDTELMGGITTRTIGRARAKVQIELINLVYNIKRVVTLIRKKYFSFDRITAPEIS
jgi:transposase, IS5 family